MNRLALIHWAAVLATAVSPALARQAKLVPLGDLPGGSNASYAYGVSGDGTTVVGYSTSSSGLEAFRWTTANGMQGLGDLPGSIFSSIAYAVSEDGSVVVGQATPAQGREAFLWTAAGGLQSLGDLPGGSVYSVALALSADGSTVAGHGSSAGGLFEAFRWDAASGMQALGDLPGGAFESKGQGISGDGQLIVGYGVAAAGPEPFAWTMSGGMTGLGLAGKAFAASHDGSVVVGSGFVWSAASGSTTVAGDAYACSADGDVVVGQAAGSAFLWTASSGLIDLQAHLVALGASGLSGWSLSRARGISADGRTIVGEGTNPAGEAEAWLADLGPPAPSTYCTSATTSHGCLPAIGSSGAPSASASGGFTITVGSVEGQRPGLVFYGIDNTGFSALPWGAGPSYLCIRPPLQRTPLLSTGGALNACDGLLSLDWNAFRSASPNALGQPFGPGQQVFAQGWFRDGAGPTSSMLSDALVFVLQP